MEIVLITIVLEWDVKKGVYVETKRYINSHLKKDFEKINKESLGHEVRRTSGE